MTDVNEELAPQVKVKGYMRNGRFVRASVRRGRNGRGMVPPSKSGAAKATSGAVNVGRAAVAKATAPKGIPMKPGSDYRNGIWYDKNGVPYGRSAQEDGEILPLGPSGAGKPSGTDYEGLTPGLTYPPGGDFRDGVWYKADGSVYGYSFAEDSPIRKTGSEAKADAAKVKPKSDSSTPVRARRGNPKDRKR